MLGMADFIKAVFNGKYTRDNLNKSLSQKYFEVLFGAVQDGFGKFDLGSPDEDLRKALESNTYLFSVTKNKALTAELQKLILDENGLVRSFADYEKDATTLIGAFNKTYLKVERDMAIQAGYANVRWNYYANDPTFPAIQYETVGDSRVRPEHAKLDNIIKPKNDPFWDVYYPPNGWRCRCTVLHLDSVDWSNTGNKVTDTNGLKIKDVPDYFKTNFGKERVIFPTNHPYYDA